MLDKTFDPKKIDSKNYKIEEKLNIFNSDTDSSKESFCIMMPPPNVTGVLHMGHALNFTLQDIIVRYKRLNNFNVLWQPGTDHAGIATQIVVEKELNKNNQNRHSLGKDNFINKVLENHFDEINKQIPSFIQEIDDKYNQKKSRKYYYLKKSHIKNRYYSSSSSSSL